MEPPTDEIRATPVSAERYRSFGRAFEIVAVVSATGLVFVYGLGFESLYSAPITIVVLVALLLIGYLMAIRYAVRTKMAEAALEQAAQMRATEETKRNEALTYKTTKARLRTLTEAGVPGDVTHAMELFLEIPPLPEKNFLELIAFDPRSDLGWERTNEFKERILRYTRVDRKEAPTAVSSRAPLSPGAGSN